MINLLPPEQKRQLRAARTNTVLLRYNIALFSSIIFLGLALGFTYIYLSNTKSNAEQVINTNKEKVSGYASVEAKAQQFRTNLTIAKQILDHEVAYTKVILEISHLLPSGVVLQNLSLDSQTFGTEYILSAQAKDYTHALALKDAFQNSPLFSNVHFQSVTSNGISGYPIGISLSVTIKKDAAK